MKRNVSRRGGLGPARTVGAGIGNLGSDGAGGGARGARGEGFEFVGFWGEGKGKGAEMRNVDVDWHVCVCVAEGGGEGGWMDEKELYFDSRGCEDRIG